MSVRAAASQAGLSEGRWRQIVLGFQQVSAGVYAPVQGPADTVARMARVAGVSPEQMVKAGREDVAEALRLLVRPAERKEPQTYAELAEVLDGDPELARAVLDLIRMSQRKGQPVEEEERPRRRDAG